MKISSGVRCGLTGGLVFLVTFALIPFSFIKLNKPVMNDLAFFHAYVNNCIEFLWWAWSWVNNVTWWTVVNKCYHVTVWNTHFTAKKHQVHLNMHAGNEYKLVSCWTFYNKLHDCVLDMCPLINNNIPL
jgi:hypothetical protein